MRFLLALNLIGTTLEQVLPLARDAEALGYDGVLLGDHIAMPEVMDARAPYMKDGRPRMGYRTPWPDPFTTIGAIAAATTRLRILTSVFVLPLRHPLAVAKAAHTAAILSDNRFVLGIGVGWLKEEFDAQGIPFAERGTRTDEAIGILRRVAATGEVEGTGPHYPFARVSVLPVPDRPVPIYVGGDSEPAYARAARLGDGYLAGSRTARGLRKVKARIDALRQESGRAADEFEFCGMCLDARGRDDYAALAGDGIETFMVLPWQDLSDTSWAPLEVKRAGMERFARQVISA